MLTNGRHSLPAPVLARLAQWLAAHTGLDFTRGRCAALERGVRAAAAEAGHADAESYAHTLLASPLRREHVEALAGHLTVGETYFFRESEALFALEHEVLPRLLRQRRSAGRRLRIWSAGCSTGEEAYSIGITLARAFPELRGWDVSILATDINPRALRTGKEAVYGEWSFRRTPEKLRDAFFCRAGEKHWRVAERVRNLIRFEYLNLGEDTYPSVVNGTNAMDVIFCRNVLMYFEASQSKRVLEKLTNALLPGGWLFLNPIEVSPLPHSRLTTVGVAGTFAYRKAGDLLKAQPVADSFSSVAAQPTAARSLRPKSQPLAGRTDHEPAHERASALYASGRYAEVIALLAPHASDADAHALLARAHANLGRLDEARAWAERAAAADKLNPSRHFLLAAICDESGLHAECERALQCALYLEPNHVLAHLTLGNLRSRQGRRDQSRRHFRNALSALGRYEGTQPVPEADGLNAAMLAAIVQATLSSEAD